MVKGGFSGDFGKCGKPANARVSRGSGVLVAACRMDADTLLNHALYHLSYTRGDHPEYYTGVEAKKQAISAPSRQKQQEWIDGAGKTRYDMADES